MGQGRWALPALGLHRDGKGCGLAETDSFHAITEFSGLFRQSKRGNGGSFAKVTKKGGGGWGNKERKPKNAD